MTHVPPFGRRVVGAGHGVWDWAGGGGGVGSVEGGGECGFARLLDTRCGVWELECWVWGLGCGVWCVVCGMWWVYGVRGGPAPHASIS